MLSVMNYCSSRRRDAKALESDLGGQPRKLILPGEGGRMTEAVDDDASQKEERPWAADWFVLRLKRQIMRRAEQPSRTSAEGRVKALLPLEVLHRQTWQIMLSREIQN
jgi:hypothetical protein